LVSRDRPEAVFSVTHAPLFGSTPVALMVQDLSFVHRPDLYRPSTGWRLRRLVARQAARAAVVLTVSEFCRADLVETFGLDPDRVLHVPNAIEDPLDVPSDELDAARRDLTERGVHEPYFLYLGNLHPRKNLGSTVEAFARARATDPRLSEHRLVVAGARWWGGSDVPAAAAEQEQVTFLGPVSAVEREVLLRSATALVYLSRFEGFGLPPLEAMRRGTPAVASDVTSLPEVTGGAALLVAPDDVAGAADALVAVATDPVLRGDLVERGRANAARYTADRTGRALRVGLDRAVDHEMEVHR
jgi:alpha-1,3-rhamnosyl/mannosyltransferase